jgi:adenosylcobinamide-GDP ribazoletransferase
MLELFRTYLNPLWLAIGFLTRIPTPFVDEDYERASHNSTLFYPLVGLLIGILIYLPIMLLPTANPFIMAIISIMVWILITGGLHLDGLADSADAWLGSQGDSERALSIMKDPMVGPAGVIALVMILLLKVAALTAILDSTLTQSDIFFSLILTPIIARALMVLLFLTTPYVRKQGLASALMDIAHYPAWIIICITFSVIIALGYFIPVICVLLTFYALRWLKLKLIAGFTGDTAGAVLEISETVFLLIIAIQVT